MMGTGQGKLNTHAQTTCRRCLSAAGPADALAAAAGLRGRLLAAA
jgi:hypothetical protein